MPRITRLHHAQITIPRGAEDTARAFYVDLLGMCEIPKPDSLLSRGGLWLKVDDIQLHLGIQDSIDRNASRAHLAWQVDDLSGWRDLLKRHGIKVAESIPIPGFERCEFRDPFGNRIELIQPS
ncbi:MAG: VOC family protein [Thermomicrobiales bacterium]|nr:VOC family protein [Thermomicrobiales bacterium]